MRMASMRSQPTGRPPTKSPLKTAAPWIAARLRLVGPVHIAESREQARKNVEYGIHQWMEYFARLNPLAPKATSGKDPIDDMIDSGPR